MGVVTAWRCSALLIEQAIALARQGDVLGLQVGKPVVYGLCLGCGAVYLVDALSQLCAIGQAGNVPAYVFARAAHTSVLAIQRVVRLQMLLQGQAHFGNGGCRQVFACA